MSRALGMQIDVDHDQQPKILVVNSQQWCAAAAVVCALLAVSFAVADKPIGQLAFGLIALWFLSPSAERFHAERPTEESTRRQS